MSTACKCDRCRALFCFAAGDVRVEYHVTEKVDEEGAPTQQCYETDLCHECSKSFLAFIAEKGESDGA